MLVLSMLYILPSAFAEKPVVEVYDNVFAQVTIYAHAKYVRIEYTLAPLYEGNLPHLKEGEIVVLASWETKGSYYRVECEQDAQKQYSLLVYEMEKMLPYPTWRLIATIDLLKHY